MPNERTIHGPNLIDASISQLGARRTGELLQRLDVAVPWRKLARIVQPIYKNDAGKGGHPNVPVVIMLKCVMLQKWFNLSDPQLEDAILDRISFRRFLGLGVEDQGIDHSTLSLFRKRLLDHGLTDKLFDATVEHLEKKGLIIGQGTMVDATIIEASTGQKRDDGTSTRDKAASYTKKHGRTHHGFKGSIATDHNGMVKDYTFDTAKVHDSQHIDQLIEDETHSVTADSAYMDKKRRKRLEARGVKCRILHKRVRGQAELTPEQKADNTRWARFRAKVEHPFATVKCRMGYVRARYRGLRRNGQDFVLTLIGANFRQSLSLESLAKV